METECFRKLVMVQNYDWFLLSFTANTASNTANFGGQADRLYLRREAEILTKICSNSRTFRQRLSTTSGDTQQTQLLPATQIWNVVTTFD